MDRRRIRQIRTRIKIKGALPNPILTPGFDLWNKLSLKFPGSDMGRGKLSVVFRLTNPTLSDMFRDKITRDQIAQAQD